MASLPGPQLFSTSRRRSSAAAAKDSRRSQICLESGSIISKDKDENTSKSLHIPCRSNRKQCKSIAKMKRCQALLGLSKSFCSSEKWIWEQI